MMYILYMTELSLCDICNMAIAMVINFLSYFPFFSSFFFLLFPSSLLLTVKMFLCGVIFFCFSNKKFSKMNEK